MLRCRRRRDEPSLQVLRELWRLETLPYLEQETLLFNPPTRHVALLLDEEEVFLREPLHLTL